MNALSRRELLDRFLRWKGALGDDAQRNRAEDLLDLAMGDIWRAHPWRDHRLPAPIQITTLASTRTYVLPGYFGRIPPKVTALRNLTTGRSIEILSLDALESAHPESGTDLETAGTPRRCAIAGVVGVAVQPSAAGQALEVLSDDADDTDIKVLVEGVDSTGAWNETQVTLTGLAAVAIGTWKTPLVTFSKSYPEATDPETEGTSSRGTVTLRVAGGGATLQTLLPEESARTFPSLVLYPKPTTAGEIIAVPALRAPKRMVYDADLVPDGWDSALLERMHDLWAVGTGEAASLPVRKGPALIDLISYDNSTEPGRIRRVPFTG